jgi:endo-1,3(4)-beta-glucanase
VGECLSFRVTQPLSITWVLLRRSFRSRTRPDLPLQHHTLLSTPQPYHQIHIYTSYHYMGPRQSRSLTFATAGNRNDSRSWHEFKRSILTSFTNTPPAVTSEIPPDNIFVPIQQDSILPQIPIGDHHPVPRTGIEDDNLRTLHTNKFYANAFLGAQNQPITTHLYTIWWGKGVQEQGLLQTWGMNISHVEEADVLYGPGNPAKVRANV